MPSFPRPPQGLVLSALLSAGLLPAAIATPAPAEDRFTPLLVSVLATPAAAPMADGRRLLPYEPVLTNVTAVPQTIESLHVRDPSRSAGPLLTLGGAGLSDDFRLPGARGTTVLGPGQSAVLLINAGFGSREALPQRLIHAAHLHFHVMDGPSPLASNGLPDVIDRFEVTGRAVSSSDLDAELRTPLKPVPVVPVPGPSLRRNRLPADLQVVRFLP